MGLLDIFRKKPKLDAQTALYELRAKIDSMMEDMNRIKQQMDEKTAQAVGHAPGSPVFNKLMLDFKQLKNELKLKQSTFNTASEQLQQLQTAASIKNTLKEEEELSKYTRALGDAQEYLDRLDEARTQRELESKKLGVFGEASEDYISETERSNKAFSAADDEFMAAVAHQEHLRDINRELGAPQPESAPAVTDDEFMAAVRARANGGAD